MVFIVGQGQTPFTQHLERSIVTLGREAAALALADAGLAPAAVEAGFFANALAGQLFGDSTLGQSVFDAAGVRGVPIINVENACTSGSSAFWLAHNAILAGQCDLALVLGAEKMCVPQMGLVGGGQSDLASKLGMAAPVGFAMRAQRHMHEFGTTAEQLAAVTAKSRKHAAHNPLAQFRKEESIADILASPMVADPLTRSQCCPIADGAAAVLLASDRLALAFSRAIRVDAALLLSGSYPQPVDLVRWETDERAARKAYEMAGIGPEDLDLIECHDAFTISEILHYEALGLCPAGEGGPLVASGATALGGRIPVNVSGGLLSRGHPVAATGIAQLCELVMQLRQEAGPRQVEDCRTALAHCMGGDKDGDTKSCTIVVLSR